MYKESKDRVDRFVFEILNANKSQRNLEIDEIVAYICKKRDLDGIDIAEVDLEASLDVQGDVSGLSYIDENWGFVLVNSDEPPYRKRFTVVHELGHLLMHHTTSQKPIISFRAEITEEGSIRYIRDKYQEYEANLFAAGLLMPLDRIKQFIDSGYSILQIANILGVSTHAIEVRLQDLRGDLIDRK